MHSQQTKPARSASKNTFYFFSYENQWNIAAKYQEYLFPMTGFLDYLQISRIP